MNEETINSTTSDSAFMSTFSKALEFLDVGGMIMYVLAVISIIGLAIAIAKAIQFQTAGVRCSRAMDSLLNAWAKGDIAAVKSILNAMRNSPAKFFVQKSMSALLSERHDTSIAREEIMRLAQNELTRQRSGLRIMGLIASISPLLGLLGTVIGMIEAFQGLEAAGNRVDPSILSGGIWVALLTTAAGLVVAIPASVAHSWMEGHVERATHIMEDIATQLITAPLQQDAPQKVQVSPAA